MGLPSLLLAHLKKVGAREGTTLREGREPFLRSKSLTFAVVPSSSSQLCSSVCLATLRPSSTSFWKEHNFKLCFFSFTSVTLTGLGVPRERNWLVWGT